MRSVCPALQIGRCTRGVGRLCIMPRTVPTIPPSHDLRENRGWLESLALSDIVWLSCLHRVCEGLGWLRGIPLFHQRSGNNFGLYRTPLRFSFSRYRNELGGHQIDALLDS